ncbi:MAG: hypothetical protein HYY49_06810 [Ignavibacteriales bacterium]|nr:hypothetical protein [Ignavibacteriales bacterium]
MKTPLIVFLAFLSLCCDPLVAPNAEGARELIYFSSFEKDADTSGWQGYGFGLSNEAPQNGGSRSLGVSGGCIWPHALLQLKPIQEDSRLIIRCVGKNLAIGGGVSLELAGDYRRSIHISVQDTAWRAYESADTLFCPAGSTLNLSLGAGGIVYSAMLVDLIEVRKVR